MLDDLEKLNMELIQAQLLLKASHELYEDILVKTARHRFSDNSKDDFSLQRDIGVRIAKFGQRDEEVRRMLTRLERLGKSPAPASAETSGAEYDRPFGAVRSK